MAPVAEVVFAQANQPPSASFTYSPRSPTPGVQVIFTSTSSDPDGRIANYEWDLDGDLDFGEPGEPVGPSATTAARSFPSPGSYVVRLRVTDGDGARAVASETVTVAQAPAGPPQLRRLPPSFQTDKVRGRHSLTARALRRVAGKGSNGRPRGQPEQESDPFGELGPICPVAACAPSSSVGLPTPLVPRPPKPFACCTGEIDPQIAAGNSYLVIGMRHKVRFYDKAGKQLYTQGAPNPAKKPAQARAAAPQKNQPYTVELCDLFKPLIPHMNAALGATLPTNLDDPDGNAISVKNGYGLNCNKATGGVRPNNWSLPPVPNDDSPDGFYHPDSTLYDARVLWDEYHQRFWIAALAYNTVTQRRVVHATWKGFANQGTYNVAHARRAMLAIAVSKTDDPRDGWNLHWTWTTPDQTTCTDNECEVYAGADFMRAGISSKYLVLSTNVGDHHVKGATYEDKYGTLEELTVGEERTQIVVLPTEPLAQNAGELAPVYSNDKPLTNPDGSHVGVLWPAVQHAQDVPGAKLFLASQYAPEDAGGSPTSHSVLLWVLAPGGSTEMYQLPVPVNAFVSTSPGAVPQQSGDATKIFASGTYNYLVYRNGSLYLAFGECGQWALGCVQSALRFVRIRLNGIVSDAQGVVTQLFVDKQVDLTFTGPAAGDPPGGLAWYGFPGVEANKNGDAVIAYERSGTFVNPESRYSVYYLDEPDIHASRLLMAGDSSFGAGRGNHHYMGMSVDPWDKTGIWMIHGFADSGQWGYAIGKALAPGYADLSFARARAFVGVAGRRSYRLRLKLRNQGDGAARASVLRVFVVRERAKASSTQRKGKRRDVLVRSVRIHRLRRGRATTVRLKVSVPARMGNSRFVKIRLDASHRVREYGERNNTVRIRLPQR